MLSADNASVSDIHSPVRPSSYSAETHTWVYVHGFNHTRRHHYSLRFTHTFPLQCYSVLHLQTSIWSCLFWLKNTFKYFFRLDLLVTSPVFFCKCCFTIVLNNFTRYTVLDRQIHSLRTLLASVSGEKLASALFLFPWSLSLSLAASVSFLSLSGVFFRYA